MAPRAKKAAAATVELTKEEKIALRKIQAHEALVALQGVGGGADEEMEFRSSVPGRWPEDDVIRSGSLGLDLAIGTGGVPKGRIVEIFGPYSSGKTTAAMHMVVEAQNAGIPCVLIDAENAFDPNYVERLGVDLDLLLVNQPLGLESAIDLMIAIMENAPEQGALIVVDSVAFLEPSKIMEDSAETQTIGLKARVWSSQMAKISRKAAKTNTTLILLNQEREKINPKPWEEKKSVPGGTAIKFGTSLRISIKRKSEGKNEVDGSSGQWCTLKIEKNKVGSPHKQAVFWLPKNARIEWAPDVIENAKLQGLILVDEKYVWDKKTGTGSFAKGKTWFSLELTESRLAAVKNDDPAAEYDGNVISVYREGKFFETMMQYPSLIEVLEEEMLDSLNDINSATKGLVVDENPEDDGDESI
jgi:protein RecA